MNPLRIGIMSIAHLHAGSYVSCLKNNPRGKIVGLADHEQERAQRFANSSGVPYFDSYEALLKVVDAVVITSENIKHAEHAIIAANAGKHIMCEKPLMTNISEGYEMLEAAKANKVTISTAFVCRFSPAMARLRDVIDKGELGEIIAVRGTNRGQCPGGWFTEPELAGGGAMIDHTVHVTDLLRWMLKSEVKNVYAEIGNNMYHSNFDDTAMVSLEFENGVFASLDSSWSRPKSNPTWGDVTMRVIGTQGFAEMDMFNQVIVHLSDDLGKGTYAGWGTNVDNQTINAWLDLLEGKNTPEANMLATGEDGFKAAEVALGAYQSTRTHATTNLPLK